MRLRTPSRNMPKECGVVLYCAITMKVLSPIQFVIRNIGVQLNAIQIARTLGLLKSSVRISSEHRVLPQPKPRTTAGTGFARTRDGIFAYNTSGSCH